MFFLVVRNFDNFWFRDLFERRFFLGMIKYYHLVFSGSDSAVHELSWPGQIVPGKQADLHVLEVKPEQLDSTIKLIMEKSFKINRIEPKRERFEDFFVTLTKKS